MGWIGEITNAGVALLDEWAQSNKTLHITHAVGFDGATAKATLTPASSTLINTSAEKCARFQLLFQPLAQAYTLDKVVIHANVDGGTDTELAIYTNSTGQEIPDSTSNPSFRFQLWCNIILDKTDHLEIAGPDPNVFITADTLNIEMAKKLSLTGGTMSGAISMGTNKITNLGAPSADTDASTKKYVDDTIGGLGTVLNFKGTKATTGALPLSNNKKGDVWIVSADNSEYVWVSSSSSGALTDYEKLGPTIDLSGYMQKGADYVTAGQKTGTTLGSKATAEGNDTTSSGSSSHAEGDTTVASGTTAHAEGHGTTASGNYSHAQGRGTTASSAYQSVIGKYNVADSQDTYAEIVGNGTADNARSNARTLDWSGNEVLAGKLTVGTAPTNNMDVATKQYVDNAVAGVTPPEEILIFDTSTISTNATAIFNACTGNIGTSFKPVFLLNISTQKLYAYQYTNNSYGVDELSLVFASIEEDRISIYNIIYDATSYTYSSTATSSIRNGYSGADMHIFDTGVF